MDDFEFQHNAQLQAAAQPKSKPAELRCVGEDKATGERLLQNEHGSLFLGKPKVQVRGQAVVVTEETLPAVLVLMPRLLQVVISGIYAGPPLPMLAEFEGGLMRHINIDALRL